MLNETELKILAALFPEGTEKTTREIERRSGYSHERAYSTLKNLEKKGKLAKKQIGKALVYSIRKFDDETYMAFAYRSIGRKEHFVEMHKSLNLAIEELMKKAKPDMVIIFGSYSKGEAKKESDVDLICIGGKNAEKIAMSLRHKHGVQLTPTIVKRSDFKNIKTENPELWDEIMAYGVIMKGHELYYELTYKAIDGEKRSRLVHRKRHLI